MVGAALDAPISLLQLPAAPNLTPHPQNNAQQPLGAEQVCKYYLAGHCAYGDKCRYDHVKPAYARKQQQQPEQLQQQARALGGGCGSSSGRAAEDPGGGGGGDTSTSGGGGGGGGVEGGPLSSW